MKRFALIAAAASTVTTGVLLGFGSAAQAQDRPEWCFDQSTLNAAERTVCDVRSLWRLDTRLNGVFERALRSVGPDREQLRRRQADWLEDVRNRCEVSIDCLTTVYRERLDRLRDVARRGYV